ncbi:helix-turn-helix domain-containing protein [Agrobacterium genomosp. 3]|nr:MULTISPECIES: helix-turn-helix domain-containing protein [Rhizobium/Agrobacterium group]MCA1867704.1 helix-turn-helix domain-containing protein [Agrobacterium tomkonis]MCA1878133.1 helix-turn-helix domain-containing protein [Agrobacterium tumefaciens]MCA1893358.1 helix-turn-helix domain-containing protein [Agrobacterium tomkonis]QCM03791.1 helix-turn-helix domain-containing protein [Agrobacterium tumefaciens]TKT56093.1 helix-turn-helix domain-containing protein [Agrobacterium sp. LC34]
MMTLPKKPLDSLVDIQKLVKQTSPAIDLARTLASIEAPAKTLRDLGKTLTVNSDLMKSIESASDIARRLMQHSDLAAKLTEGLPKIDLNLPDISTSIKASLPKQLPDFSALPPAPSPVAMPKASPETFVQADFQIDSIADLGRMVRRLRERRKQSQQEFADLAGVGRRFISELENGKPTLEFAKVLQVARAAGISFIARDRSL